MRRLAINAALLVVVGAPTLTALPGSARPAAASSTQERGVVEVIEVSGYLDPVLVDFVDRAIDNAEREDAVALVIQLDSPGAVVGEGRLERLIRRVEQAAVTIGVWVGPSGARAEGDAARLVAAADHVGVGPGGGVEVDGRFLGPNAARRQGIAEFPAPTVGDFIVNLPDVETRQVRRGDQTRREPVTRTRFSALSPVDELMHTVASPPVAYLLLLVGMALLVFELYTAGVGVAGVVGAGCLVLAFYGLAVLPVTVPGVVLLVLSMFAHAVDIQTGVRQVWTAVGTALLVLGSLVFYDGVSMSWITLVITIVGVTLFMVVGVPTMARTRFSARRIDRDWLVGEEGAARTAIDPTGVALVRGAPWRARVVPGTTIGAGGGLRVVRLDGLWLEVEPMSGAVGGYPKTSGVGRVRGNGDRG